MGAVNAVATLGALGVAICWWLLHLPLRTGRGSSESSAGRRRWWRFGCWWALGLVMACAWWIAPLLIMSEVSPPFLDFIESSRVTTQWTSLTEVLRGTSSWTPFVSPERVAGAVLVTQPAAVLATGVLAAAGLAGLAMRRMPHRGPLIAVLIVGLGLMCLGYAGTPGSPVAEQVRVFLDGAGAPLRNIHKFEPFIRIPLVLGIAHLLARVPVPPMVPVRESLAAFAHPQRSRPVAAAVVVLVAIVGAGSLMWTGQLTPADAYRDIPRYWTQAADWLAAQQDSATDPDSDTDETDDLRARPRALVVPGAPFADQIWGLTRDEPLQPLADTPWAVRDAIPLTPPGAIRAMDAIQRQIAVGHGSEGLSAALASQGIGYVVLRADLDPDTSRSARPLLAQQALDDSPGLRPVARFGPEVGPPGVDDVVRDNGLRPTMPAIQIYAVGDDEDASAPADTGPRLTDLDSTPRIVGGPESLALLDRFRGQIGAPPMPVSILESDARRAGLDAQRVIVTDTPTDRETDFGRVDDHSSAIRSADDPRRTQNAAADYPVDGADLVRAQWLLDNRPDHVSISTTGSASDATQPGQTSPANSPAAAFDDDPDTAWVSNGLESAVGKWLRIDFAEPRTGLAVTLTTAKAIGPDVTSILITTDAGSTVAQGLEPGEPTTISIPGGATRRIEIRAIGIDGYGPGNQFALGEVSLTDLNSGAPLDIRQRIVLPELAPGTDVDGWILGQELAGRPECVNDPHADPPRVRCAAGLGLAPESPGVFTRALSVPERNRPEGNGPGGNGNGSDGSVPGASNGRAGVAVEPVAVLRPRPGDGLNALLYQRGRIVARGPSSVVDPRGSAQAAVDGDPATTWIAPEPTGDNKKDGDEKDGDEKDGDEKDGDESGDEQDREQKDPELTLQLPTAQRVERLRLITDDYPAAPTEVTVDLGTGPQKRTVGEDGTVTLDPAVTDQISIVIRESADIIDVNALGFARPAPTGIAEVEIGPTPTATPVDPDRTITVGCDAGIGITVAGQVMGLSVTTTEGALRSGEPVTARPCTDNPLVLPAGEQELSVNPGSAFTVDTVGLRVVPEPGWALSDVVGGPAVGGDQRAVTPTTEKWAATERAVTVPAASSDRVLSVPESTNGGWVATLRTGDGERELTPVVVNGWQQGWLVPAGAGGTVAMTFGLDTPYRWSIGVGLAVMALLLVLAMLPLRLLPARRGRDDENTDGPEPLPALAMPVCAAAAWLGASWLLGGWWGLGIAAVTAGALATVAARIGDADRAAHVTVITTFVGFATATVLLAAGPWHAAGGYRGDNGWVQGAALISVSALTASALLPALRDRSSRTRFSRARFSRARSQRRAGSSTNA